MDGCLAKVICGAADLPTAQVGKSDIRSLALNLNSFFEERASRR